MFSLNVFSNWFTLIVIANLIVGTIHMLASSLLCHTAVKMWLAELKITLQRFADGSQLDESPYRH